MQPSPNPGRTSEASSTPLEQLCLVPRKATWDQSCSITYMVLAHVAPCCSFAGSAFLKTLLGSSCRAFLSAPSSLEWSSCGAKVGGQFQGGGRGGGLLIQEEYEWSCEIISPRPHPYGYRQRKTKIALDHKMCLSVTGLFPHKH